MKKSTATSIASQTPQTRTTRAGGRALEVVDDVIDLSAVEDVTDCRHQKTRSTHESELIGLRGHAVEEYRPIALNEARGGGERGGDGVGGEEVLGVVEDGRQVEEQHEPEAHDVVDVTIEDVEGTDEEPDADDQHALGKRQHGKEQQRRCERSAV